MALDTDAFYAELLAGNFSKRDRGRMAGANYKLAYQYASKTLDPQAHTLAKNNPQQVKALTDNGKMASFDAISGPVWP